jgi:putative membrane protein
MRSLWTRLGHVGLIAGLALPVGAHAADPAKVSQEDRQFVTKAARDGMFEVKAGEYAAENASSEQVKQFGQHMASDHGKANDSLRSVARSAGIEVPQQLDSEHQAKLDNLSKLQGPDFDRAYMKEMVEGHEHAVKEFRKEAMQPSSDVDRWAAKTLPTLEQHLEQARKLHQQVEGSAAARPADR